MSETGLFCSQQRRSVPVSQVAPSVPPSSPLRAQTTDNHWRQLLPLLPSHETPYLALVLRQQPLFRETKTARRCLSGPGTEGHVPPLFGSFHRKCPPFFCSSVRSSTCLTVRTKTYRWVDECTVLLLLTCLRLYGFAVSMFCFFVFRGGGTETLVKKTKQSEEYCKTCNLCNCWP